jgi:hypothetical protein
MAIVYIEIIAPGRKKRVPTTWNDGIGYTYTHQSLGGNLCVS